VRRRKSLLATILLVVVVLMAGSVPVAATAAGTGPDDALTPAAEWQAVPPGKQHWYAFYYAGDGSQIEIRMQVEPHESAAFEVWTPEEIQRWRQGLEADPIGRGSPDPFAEGVLVWTGSFTTLGTYYAVVERVGSQPGTSYYLLEISGQGVSLAPPTPTATPTPTPDKRRSTVAAPSKPAGKLVFQTAFGGNLYVIHADGSGLERITTGVDPMWSPNGQQIAFTRWQEPRGVWVIDTENGNEWRAFDWSETRWPSWSPEGDEILFSRQDGGRTEETERCFFGFCFTIPARPHWKLGIVQPSDGAFHEPSGSNVSLAPMWSPDGERIVYDGEQGLVVQSLDGEVSYQITQDARDTSPAWSPDGGRVAFTRRQHDHWEVYVVDADGRNLTRLTDTPKKPNGELGNSAAAAWSPDGQYLAFLTDRTGKWEIWIMRANGSSQKPMFGSALAGLPLEYSFVSERAISWTK
jgi:hypothetical protein